MVLNSTGSGKRGWLNGLKYENSGKMVLSCKKRGPFRFKIFVDPEVFGQISRVPHMIFAGTSAINQSFEHFMKED